MSRQWAGCAQAPHSSRPFRRRCRQALRVPAGHGQRPPWSGRMERKPWEGWPASSALAVAPIQRWLERKAPSVAPNQSGVRQEEKIAAAGPFLEERSRCGFILGFALIENRAPGCHIIGVARRAAILPAATAMFPLEVEPLTSRGGHISQFEAAVSRWPFSFLPCGATGKTTSEIRWTCELEISVVTFPRTHAMGGRV